LGRTKGGRNEDFQAKAGSEGCFQKAGIEGGKALLTCELARKTRAPNHFHALMGKLLVICIAIGLALVIGFSIWVIAL